MEKVAHTESTAHADTQSTIRFVIVSLVVIALVRTFLASPFIVEGASMDPTFRDNDYLIIDKLSYRFNEPSRGDIIVFSYPYDPSMHHIKRIVGVPGDTVYVHDNLVEITRAGQTHKFMLDEAYVLPTHNQMTLTDYRTLGADEYYVMGDNRDVSLDSRRYGALNRSYITGRVLVRLYPFSTAGVFPGYAHEIADTVSQ